VCVVIGHFEDSTTTAESAEAWLELLFVAVAGAAAGAAAGEAAGFVAGVVDEELEW